MKSFFKSFRSKFFESVPSFVIVCFSKCIAILWFDILRVRRQLLISNISQAFPEWDEKKVVKVSRKSLETLGRGVVDVIRLPYLRGSFFKESFRIEGKSNFDKALSKNKGVMLLSLHLGSGDLAISALNYFGLKVNLISKEFKSKWLNDYWFKARGRHGTKFISDRKSSFAILKALKRNETVFFISDQFMGPPLGCKVRFFGRETGAAMGAGVFALKTGAPVIPVYTYVNDDGTSTICFEEEISLIEKPTREETIRYMTQVYTDKIEEIVRKHPEQWMWVHNRWKEFKE